MPLNNDSGDKILAPDAILEMGYQVYNAETGQIYGQYPRLEDACLLIYDISRHGPFHVGVVYGPIHETLLTTEQ